MSFVQRELKRIETALRGKQSDANRARLASAQQALAWAMEPSGFASPFEAIAKSSPDFVTDILASSADCPASPRHPASSGI